MADNIQIKDAAGTSTNWGTSEGADSQHRQHIVPTDGEGQLASFADGDTYTAGTSGLLAGLAGIYQTTISTVTAGKIALARLSERRAVLTAADHYPLTLASGTPAPAGSDIVDGGNNAIVAGDLAIRADVTSIFVIPMAIAGWKNIVVRVGTSAEVFDQSLGVTFYGVTGPYNGTAGLLASAAIPSSANRLISFGCAPVGIGGLAGPSTVTADYEYYSVPALSAGWSYVRIAVNPGGAPTTGELQLMIVRST